MSTSVWCCLGLLFLTIATVIVISVLNQRKITQGSVYQRRFIPSHTRVRCGSEAIIVGKKIFRFRNDYPYVVPDAWLIRIQANDKEGNILTADYYVSKDVYDSFQIGSIFKYSRKRGDSKYMPKS